MNKIKTALLSVWDKTNIVDLAKFLIKNKRLTQKLLILEKHMGDHVIHEIHENVYFH